MAHNGTASTIPNAESRPWLRIPEAGAYVGLGRSAAYGAANRGEIPTVRMGRRLVVPTAELRRLLGLDV